MNEEEILKYIKENTINELNIKIDENIFGLGQFNLDIIKELVKIKSKYSIEFKFYKKIIGIINQNEPIIFKSKDNYLFVKYESKKGETNEETKRRKNKY